MGGTHPTIVTRMFMAASLVMPLLFVNACDGRKEQLDAEVRRLCEIDGGVKVFESVTLTQNEYRMLLDESGELKIPFKGNARPTDLFYRDSKTEFLRKGNPEMWKTIYMLVRQADGKILATTVFYSRRGGDLPGPWHDSYYGCPDTKTTPDMAKLAIKSED